MPRITAHTPEAACKIIADANVDAVKAALCDIAFSACGESESGGDTAAVVYEALAHLGIVIP